MRQKPCILSEKDSVRVHELSYSVGEWKETLFLLKYLEEKYDIDEIDFKDNQFGLGAYQYPAAVAYLKLLVNIKLFGYDQKSGGFSNVFVKYAEKRIKKVEKKIASVHKLSSNNLALLSFQIIHLLSILGDIFLAQDNLQNITKTYYKYAKYISNSFHGNVVEVCEKYWHLYFEDSPYASDNVNGQDVLGLKISPSAFANTLDLFFTEYLEERKIKVFANNPNLISCYASALNYAGDNEPCLLIGETGTGKELVAKIIHEFSQRRENNFWKVNCAGFTDSLFNSEISGIITGAATGVRTRLGAFLTACGRDENGKRKNGYYVRRRKNSEEIRFTINGEDVGRDPTDDELKDCSGTLFLDEVNSLPIALQAKLLRIIQESQVQVVGEDRTRKFNVKIICAANRDLNNNDHQGEFREDLYYRISRGIIKLPPLREIRESIAGIAKYKIEEISKQINYDKDIRISSNAVKKLKYYKWPGNFRELENVLYRAAKNMILDGDNVLKHGHIENLISREIQLNELDNFFADKTHAEIEKMYLEYIWEKAKRNKAEAMRLCGFKSKTPIHTRLRKYGLSS